MKTNKPALLDINVLIALVDPAHIFHDPAHEWFAAHRRFGWATCPITENGCLRILSRAGYPYSGLTIADVRGVIAGLTALDGHSFWPDSVSILEAGRFDLAGAGPKNLTDLYLVALAKRNNGRLATFDRNVHWEWVEGCASGDVSVIAD